MTDIPEGLPSLAPGAHSPGSGVACVMELVSVLAGEEWSDDPSVVHPLLRMAAIKVNDYVADEDRGMLLPLVPRFFGTHYSMLDVPLLRYFHQWGPKHLENDMDPATVTTVSMGHYLREKFPEGRDPDCQMWQVQTNHQYQHTCSVQTVGWLQGALAVADKFRPFPPRLITPCQAERAREVVLTH